MNFLKRCILLKFSKPELDYLSTLFGFIVAITTVLTANEVIDKKVGSVVAGISGCVVSLLINNPASIHPTTEETEDKLSKENTETQ